MLKLVGFLLLSLLAFAKDPDRTVTYGRDFGPSPIPGFDKGYLIFTNRPNGVEVWGPDGKLAFQTALTSRPELNVMSADVDSDGTVAVSVAFSVAPLGYAGGIVFLDRLGKVARFVETGRYMPSSICFDAKHALWAFGWQRDAVLNGHEDSEEYFLFRKFSSDGKPAGAYAPRSLFPKPGLPPGTGQTGGWRLRSSGDRVGAIAESGRTSENPEWIELNLDGTLMGHWKLGADAHMGTGFTSSAGLCRQRYQGSHSQVDCFDRTGQTWKTLGGLSTVDEDGHPLGALLGADGEYLVFGREESGLRLSWVLASLD